MKIAISFASGDEAVGALFSDPKGKRKEEAPEGTSSRGPNNKKKKGKGKAPLRDDSLVAATEPKRERPPRGRFDDMLSKPCPYHQGPVHHTLAQCVMLKKHYSRQPFKDDAGKKPARDQEDEGGKDDEFPPIDKCLMIFGGPGTAPTPRQRKRERREVYSAGPATPCFLDWSHDAITFSRDDHPDYVPSPGRYPLVVDPVVGNTRLSKVLMDGGSGLNILYTETLDSMGISRSLLRAVTSPFHGIVPGKSVQPLGQIDLPIYFGIPDNFRKEVLTFEVVGFPGTYHAILVRPCYTKFMAVPNYTHLKLKMPGPKGVITIGASY